MKAPKERRQAKPEVQQPITVFQAKAPDYRESYANSAEVLVSMWDFKVRFGRTEQTGDQLLVSIFQDVDLSPQQAKAVSNLLASHVERYERTFGVINIVAQAPPATPIETVNGSRPQ